MKNNYKITIIQILLIFSIIIGTLSIFLKYVVLDENTYLNILSDSGTYDEIKDSVYKKIDGVLSSKNINIDIKESIITDEDIKKEADNAISGIIEYLKTGENNVKPIDTSIYKKRISDMLNSILGNVIKPTSNDLALNSKYEAESMLCAENKFQINEMNYIKNKSNVGQGLIKVEKLMNQREAEARVKEILKQKGLTEEQAIKKATEKGITEDQALKILAGYGITIDDYKSDENDSVAGKSADNSNDSYAQDSNSVSESSKKETSLNDETSNIINKVQGDKGVKSGLDNIKNKLLDEADKNIEKEIEKMNFNKVLESSKFQMLAMITSTMYKLFWLIIVVPIIIMAILIKINDKNLNSSFKYIRNAFLLAGLILFAIFFGAYVVKVYEKININTIYFKDVMSYTIKHFLMVLSTYGFITFVIGLFLFIPTIKKSK